MLLCLSVNTNFTIFFNFKFSHFFFNHSFNPAHIFYSVGSALWLISPHLQEKGQNDIYFFTAESIAVVASSPFLEHLHKVGIGVLCMANTVDEYAVQLLKDFDGKKLNPERRSR